MLADAKENDVVSLIASGSNTRVGYACAVLTQASGINPGLVGEIPAPAVDVDSVIATIASAATAQTVTTLDGAGVGGAGAEMEPARKVALVLNSHADWDATTATVYGIDANGLACQATFTIPNGGNATVAQNENVYFKRIVSLSIPAQAGTNGTATLGVTADTGIYSSGSLRFPLYDASREPYASTDTYADEDPVPCLKKGRMWASVVAGTAGQQLYMRMVESGANYRGELRGGTATNFVPVLGASIIQMSGSTLALIEVK
jgi:hypothetical protein